MTQTDKHSVTENSIFQDFRTVAQQAEHVAHMLDTYSEGFIIQEHLLSSYDRSKNLDARKIQYVPEEDTAEYVYYHMSKTVFKKCFHMEKRPQRHMGLWVYESMLRSEVVHVFNTISEDMDKEDISLSDTAEGSVLSRLMYLDFFTTDVSPFKEYYADVSMSVLIVLLWLHEQGVLFDALTRLATAHKHTLQTKNAQQKYAAEIVLKTHVLSSVYEVLQQDDVELPIDWRGPMTASLCVQQFGEMEATGDAFLAMFLKVIEETRTPASQTKTFAPLEHFIA